MADCKKCNDTGKLVDPAEWPYCDCVKGAILLDTDDAAFDDLCDAIDALTRGSADKEACDGE